MTPEDIKALLSTPVALFVIMLLASFGSAWKQMLVARRSGTEISVSAYFLKNWPETVAMLGHNAIAFVTLIFTDQLGWAAAIGLGYIANDAADAYTKEGRSVSMGTPRQGGYARVAMLLFIAAIGSMVLAACTTTPAKVIQAGCEQDASFDVKRCAKTIGETYEIYQKRVLDAVRDPETPADVKTRLQKFDREATPAVVELLRGARTYDRIASEVAAGTTEAEQLAIANQNMQRYIAEALPRLYALIDAFGG